MKRSIVDRVEKSLSFGSSHTLSKLQQRAAQLRIGDDRVWARSKTYIVILGEAEETADLGSALGAETLGVNDVGEAGDVSLALLDDGKSKNREIHAGDATTDGLSLALTSAAGAVAGVAVSEEETDTVGSHNTLLHGETLLVVATSDAEDVALPLIAKGVAGDLSTHLKRVVSIRGCIVGFAGWLTYALLHEGVELALLIDFDELLAAVGRVGNVQL